MGIRADPPDAIDKDSYAVTDVSAWGKAAAGLAIGTAIATVAIGVGYAGGKSGSTMLTQATGLDNAAGENGPVAEVV